MGRPQTIASTLYRIIMHNNGTNFGCDHLSLHNKKSGAVPILSKLPKNAGRSRSS